MGTCTRSAVYSGKLGGELRSLGAEGYAARAAISPRRRALAAILWITLVAGTLDIGENIIYNAFRSVTPYMIFQYIASGLIGRAAFGAGWASVALGVLIHYLIAFTWAAIFFMASWKLPVLVRRAVVAGLIYGGIVYLLMTYLVLPLTRVPHLTRPITLAGRVNAIAALLFCIGLTIALLTRRHFQTQ